MLLGTIKLEKVLEMIKILTMLFMFFRELIFGKNGESDNDTNTTKVKKWFILAVLCSSFMLNYILAKRMYEISISHIAIIKEVNGVRGIKEELEKEKAKTANLEKYLKMCFKDHEVSGIRSGK